MPLRALLDNTLRFSRQKIFYPSSTRIGTWEYIARFSNSLHLQKSRIHPIESFVEYIKYSRKHL